MKYLYYRSRRTIKENYRETEKAVLDSILGKGYDKRIRPSGQNITGNRKFVLCFVRIVLDSTKNCNVPEANIWLRGKRFWLWPNLSWRECQKLSEYTANFRNWSFLSFLFLKWKLKWPNATWQKFENVEERFSDNL